MVVSHVPKSDDDAFQKCCTPFLCEKPDRWSLAPCCCCVNPDGGNHRDLVRMYGTDMKLDHTGNGARQPV